MFLFDEPLSNLDAALRVQTRIEIARLHRRLGTTMIYVTHDQVEAMTLVDKIVVLRGGNIEQIGTPIELYENPQNMFVAQFIGSPKMNFFMAKDLTGAGQKLLKGDTDCLGIRPEHLVPAGRKKPLITATPDLVENLGENALVHCKTPAGAEFIVKTTDLAPFTGAGTIGLIAEPGRVHHFDSTTQLRASQR